ncbi:lysoplasmalogenase [Peterkaempfera griseoplana]|uniref:lysoplasmalogenase n=1 Tax=Peterkaempfera griseoplana TaxID=66896 RepID=UPI0006E2EA59|nr:lysoplasmalogenase [Peterkaempfera griseoplana]
MTLRHHGAARVLLLAFAAAGTVHLMALAAGVPALAHASKPALMLLLAAHAATAEDRFPRLLATALLFGAAGDTLLESGADTAFLAGMGCFAAGHVCYVALFTRHGAFADRRRAAVPIAAYGILWVALIASLWPGLGGLRIPVAAYSLLLTATAASSAGLGLRAGAGGALFLLSDGLIAAGLADWPQPPGRDLWVMGTYLAAQYLLTSAALRLPPPGPAAVRSPGARPAVT